MQHSEEVGAGEELGAGRLEQQCEAGPGAGLGHRLVPPQLYTHTHTNRRSVIFNAAAKIRRMLA